MKRRSKKSGRWEIERERCQIGDRFPSKGVNDPVPMEGLLPSVLKSLGMEESHWSSILEEDWADVVGKEVAGHTRPGTFHAGALTIFVDSSVWMSELQRYGKDKILKNLRDRFGSKRIKTIGFKLDPEG